jgi:sarcosine oxidase subunit alpha
MSAMPTSKSDRNPAASVTIIVDSKPCVVPGDVSVAAALLTAGITVFRRSVTGEPRAPLCGMGICYECRLTIDDVANRRSCLVPVTEGMRVRTSMTKEPSR